MTNQLVAESPAFERIGRSRTKDTIFWASIAAVVAIVCACVSRESLWIDEGYTAWVAAHPSLGALFSEIASPLNNPEDRQVPLYTVYVWTWCRIFGHSEVAMRCSNFPFVAAYVLAIALSSRFILGRMISWLPLAIAPFVWYYTSEARPYCCVTAISTIVVGSALSWAYGETESARKWGAWSLMGSLTVALATSILTVFLLPGLITFLLLTWQANRRSRIGSVAGPLFVFCPLLLALLVFYATTVVGSGLKAEIGSNRRPIAPIAYTAQVVYEYFGFDGLGPPRNDLRTSGRTSVASYLPFIALGALLIACAILASFRSGRDRRFEHLTIAWLVAIAFATAVATILHTRFLGRHLAPTFPLFAFALIALLRDRLAIACVAVAFAISDIRLTARAEYWKDDYRGAVRDVLSRQAVRPGSIVWVADPRTASYYGLDVHYPDNPAFKHLMIIHKNDVAWSFSGVGLTNASARKLLKWHKVTGRPVYVVVSKPDIFDPNGAWQAMVAERKAVATAHFRAFDLFVF